MNVLSINKIYNEDCLIGMRQMQDKSIDLIVTDPPYKVTSKGCAGTMSGYWTNQKSNDGKIFDCNDIDIQEYIQEFYRLLKDDAHCYIMCNNLNLPHFFDVISNKSDFKFVKLLVWDKQSKICGRYYMGQVEHIFMLRKGKDKPINNCGMSDLLAFPLKRDKDDKGNNIHDSQKPVDLFRALVSQSSNKGDLILDPFMGSGTTAIACMKENRHFIGFELDKNYYKIANERIKIEQSQLSLF